MTGVLAQTIAFHRDPLGFLSREREAHGEVFEIRLLTARPIAVVADPELAETLLDADPERAEAGAARRRLLPFASPRSVFGGDGRAHRSARQLIAPAFATEAMDRRREEMAAIAARHADAWPRGIPFRLLERMRNVADEIFVRIVLGVGDRDRAERLIAAGQDVLGLMVGDGGLGTEEIVDQLGSLLMAAQEPPSIALTSLLDRLAREPEHAEAFRAEPGGERADAIVREALRLDPPAAGVLRRLREPLRGAGWELPAGMTALVSIPLLHRDPRAYDRPERFEPGRWSRDRRPGFFLPFGGGERRCVGEPLARGAGVGRPGRARTRPAAPPAARTRTDGAARHGAGAAAQRAGDRRVGREADERDGVDDAGRVESPQLGSPSVDG